MSIKVIVVGSGASGVQFALTLLRKGHEVTMVDTGYCSAETVDIDASVDDLKAKLNDPIEYFLGRNFEGIIYPDVESEYYGIPPSKNYVFRQVPWFKFKSRGFEPLISFGKGGLAEVWTAGVYPLNDDELNEFPISYHDLRPYYEEVADRIGITGENDDLSHLYPFHNNLMPPLKLDQHSEHLLKRYRIKKRLLNEKFGVLMGRSRVATLSNNKDGREACDYTGRCLWGCPKKSLYTPAITLADCETYSNFNYRPNLYVTHFVYNSDHHITQIVAKSVEDGRVNEFEADKFVLAAGTLSTSKIFLESIYCNTGNILKLSGLMDNRQILVPFLNFDMLCQQYQAENYQYHQVAMCIKNRRPARNVHAQITTLKSGQIHPIIQNVPLDYKAATLLFRNVRAALGILNINLFDYRREKNFITLGFTDAPDLLELVINYEAATDESKKIAEAFKISRRALRVLGCIVPPGMSHIRPMGASVHYSGTIPMSTTREPLTVSKNCRSHDFDNLYIADGASFPFLPAKNMTFTLMANAVRIADSEF